MNGPLIYTHGVLLTLTMTIGMVFSCEIVHPKLKFIIYSLSCHIKPVWFAFLCETQNILNNIGVQAVIEPFDFYCMDQIKTAIFQNTVSSFVFYRKKRVIQVLENNFFFLPETISSVINSVQFISHWYCVLKRSLKTSQLIHHVD